MSILDRKTLGACFVALLGLTTAGLAQNAPASDQQPKPPMQQPPMQQKDQPKPAPDQAQGQKTAECPAFVRGAKLKLNNIDQGVQFTITAGKPEHVDALRKTAREVADFVEQNERGTGTMDTTEQAARAQQFPPLAIDVKNVDQGSQVTIKAEQKADVGDLRAKAKDVERLWQSSRCINGNAQKSAG